MLLFLHQVIYYRYNPNSWRMHILNERVGIIYTAGSLCNDTSSKLLLVCCGSSSDVFSGVAHRGYAGRGDTFLVILIVVKQVKVIAGYGVAGHCNAVCGDAGRGDAGRGDAFCGDTGCGDVGCGDADHCNADFGDAGHGDADDADAC